MAKHVTPNGKEIEIKRDSRGLFVIAFTSGGELPEELQGSFTDTAKANRAISVYLSKKIATTAKVEKDAKSTV